METVEAVIPVGHIEVPTGYPTRASSRGKIVSCF